jgi:surfeit locus 1 family protein
MKKYQFRFRFGFTLFWLTFFCLFCVLGVWQLHRYHYKKNLLQMYQTRLTASPITLADALSSKDLTFQHVKLSGEYLNSQTMFVQNQLYNDQMGFEVLTPVRMPGDDKLLLVDRGWVAKPEQKALPIISSVNGTQAINGHIKLLNEYQFILGDNVLNPTAKPIIMQKVDVAQISMLTHEAFYPFLLRLDVDAPNGFVRDSTAITTVMPERHMGYAIQWFVMALVLMIAYFSFCFERVALPRSEKKNAK